MSTISLIKDKLDIVSEIQADGVQLKKAGRYWKGLCPFHSEKTPSFTVDPDSQTYRCYGGCHERGDVLDFYAKRHGLTLDETIDHYCQKLGINRKKSPDSANLERLYGLLNEATICYARAYKKTPSAKAYVQGRGISDEDVAKWQIGFAPGTSRQGNTLLKYLKQLGYSEKLLNDVGLITQNEDRSWRDYFISRLLFPIHDKRGRVVGFGARTLGKNGAKYINSPETPLFKKSHLLYGLHLAKEAIWATREVIVVEGYTDVIAAHRAGYINTVGQMGTVLTTEQISQLKDARRIVMALDGDNAGREAVERALEHVGKLSADIFIARLPDGVDVDEAIQQGIFSDILAQAIPATDYLIERTALLLTAGASVVERTKLAEKALPMLMRLESDVIRQTSIQQLAQRFNLDSSALLKQVKIEPKSEVREPKKTTSWTAEDYLITAFLQDSSLFERIQTDFIFLDDALTEQDFPRLSHLFKRILQGMDTQQIASELGEDVLPQDEADTITYEQLYRHALVLRLRYIQREINHHFENSETVSDLQKRKAIILKEMRTG